MKKPYLLIAAKAGPGLDDLLATAGFAPSGPPADCRFYGYLDDDKLTKSRGVLLTGLMDDSTETVLARAGLVAWSAYDAPKPPEAGRPVREIVAMVDGRRWIETLAALLATGFEPIKDDAFVVKMQDQGAFVSGYTRLTDDELQAIDGVDEAGEVVHVAATHPGLHASTDGSTKFVGDGDDLSISG